MDLTGGVHTLDEETRRHKGTHIDLLGRVSMINSLIDYHYSAGVEFEFGLRSLDFSLGQWQTAIDGSEIDSYSVGFLTPVADRLDMEIRYSRDESERYDGTNAVALYLYYFGGS